MPGVPGVEARAVARAPRFERQEANADAAMIRDEDHRMVMVMGMVIVREDCVA